MSERFETDDPETFLYWVAEELISFTGSISHMEKPLTLKQIAKEQERLKKIEFSESAMVYEEYLLRAGEIVKEALDDLRDFEVTKENLKDFKECAAEKFDDLTTLLDSDSLVLRPDYREFHGVIEF